MNNNELREDGGIGTGRGDKAPFVRRDSPSYLLVNPSSEQMCEDKASNQLQVWKKVNVLRVA